MHVGFVLNVLFDFSLIDCYCLFTIVFRQCSFFQFFPIAYLHWCIIIVSFAHISCSKYIVSHHIQYKLFRFWSEFKSTSTFSPYFGPSPNWIIRKLLQSSRNLQCWWARLSQSGRPKAGEQLVLPQSLLGTHAPSIPSTRISIHCRPSKRPKSTLPKRGP